MIFLFQFKINAIAVFLFQINGSFKMGIDFFPIHVIHTFNNWNLLIIFHRNNLISVLKIIVLM